MANRLKVPKRKDEWIEMRVLWRDGLPRRQRARDLDLMIFWQNETSPAFRREFDDDFMTFEWYVMREAVRLIESATSCGQQ